MPSAPTILRGTVETLDILQTQRRFDVSDTINRLEGDITPLVRFTHAGSDRRALIKTKVATDPEYRWFERQLVPGRDQINNAAGYSAVATSIVVDNASYWAIGDIGMVSRTRERFRVTTVTTATNTLVVTRNWGNAGAAAINDNDELIINGLAMAEGSTAPTERTTQSALGYNYIQEFRWPWTMTRTLQNTTTWTGKTWPEEAKQAAIQYNLMKERSFLFGVRNQDTSGTTALRTSGGLLAAITQNSINVSGSLQEPELNRMIRLCFRYNAPGNRRAKLLVCSPLVADAITSFASTKQLVTNPRSEEYGMDIQTFRSGSGTLHIVRHILFQDSTEFNGYGFICDMPNLTVRHLQNCQDQVDTNIQAPGTHARTDEYWGYYGWQIEWDDTHGVIYGITGY